MGHDIFFPIFSSIFITSILSTLDQEFWRYAPCSIRHALCAMLFTQTSS